MASYCTKNNCKTNNVNNYYASGDSMMRKKYANKFKKISSSANGSFSLNGNTSQTLQIRDIRRIMALRYWSFSGY